MYYNLLLIGLGPKLAEIMLYILQDSAITSTQQYNLA